jgi:heme O synthase-like polyprenyltransferase
VAAACDAVRCWMDEGIDKAMTKFNRKPASEEKADPEKK